MDTIAITPTLDALLEEVERKASHIEGGPCEYYLGRGLPMSKKRCFMCERLASLIDLGISWQQQIDSGRLTGRTIEVVENPTVKSSRDAEACWKLYTSCDNAQRLAGQSLLRRYYASFSCGGHYYLLRDVTSEQPSVLPVLSIMIDQIIQLFTGEGLPVNFVHGNPTLASITFLGRLPVALRHPTYSSRSLIQIDYGGIDSAALTGAAVALMSRQRLVVGDEPLGAIVVSEDKIFIRPEASFPSFLREYPRYAKIIAPYLLIRGLLSLYPDSSVGSSKAKTLREAFEEIRGKTIPISLSGLSSSVMTGTTV